MPSYSIKSPFDSSTPQKDHYRNRFDSIAVDQKAGYAFRYETGVKYNTWIVNPFDAENILPKNTNLIRFASEGRGSYQTWSYFDALREFEHPSTGIPAKFEWTRSFDTASTGRFQTVKPSYQQIVNQFDSIIFLKQVGTSGRFSANAKMFEQLSNCFDVMPGYQNTITLARFDASGNTLTAVPMHKQAFVKSGWHILIRNVETNVTRDFGFIDKDAVEKSINDIDLADGDYEITLFYSSLFWQNAVDRVVRNVTIKSGEEPTIGLPPILNLRSEVEDGVTRILWDSETGFDDSTFGLWFAETPPVVVFREPDQTVAYTASQLEYRASVVQSLPMWCVVMAFKGNMRGPASEIFLDWSNDSPRHPDDQMAFDLTMRIEQSEHEQSARRGFATATGESGAVVSEWNPEDGFW